MYNFLNSMYYPRGSVTYKMSPEELIEMFSFIPSGLITAFCIVCFLLAVICTIGYWKMFEKAGEDGWKILIPLYNSYIITKIAYGNGWKFLLTLVPIIRYIFPIMLAVRTAQAYGKSTGFGILKVFFPEICLLLLGFGKCDYEGPIDSFM